MNNFADVEEFAREHARCGGLTPKASSWPGREGYHLEITCACGATHNRWITAEEARQPLGPSAKAPVAPPPAPASVMLAPATRIAAVAAPAAPAPIAPAARSATASPPASSIPVESAARVSTVPASAPIAPPSGMPVPVAPEHLMTAISHSPTPGAPVPVMSQSVPWPVRPPAPAATRAEVVVAPVRSGSRGRVVWLVLLLLVAGAAGAGTYVFGVPDLPEIPDVGRLLGQPAKAANPPQPQPTASTKAAPAPVAATPPPAADSIAHALRDLQTSITPSVALNDYASRVAATRMDVEHQLASAPEPARTHAREVLDIHRLAVSAWRARTLDERDEWERIGRDSTIELCPAVKRAVEAAAPARGASRGQARGVAVAASLQQLWDCAAEKAALVSSRPAGPAAYPSGA
jgi:hypothetical protein